MNKTDLVSESDKVRIKRTIRQFNKRAEIIETTKSNVDLKKVLNTGRFDFEEAAKNTQWLVEDRYQVNPETEEYGVSSFVYEPRKPFQPERLKKVLDDHFVLGITNLDQTGHGTDMDPHANCGVGGEDEEMEGEEEGEEEDEEEETEE